MANENLVANQSLKEQSSTKGGVFAKILLIVAAFFAFSAASNFAWSQGASAAYDIEEMISLLIQGFFYNIPDFLFGVGIIVLVVSTFLKNKISNIVFAIGSFFLALMLFIFAIDRISNMIELAEIESLHDVHFPPYLIPTYVLYIFAALIGSLGLVAVGLHYLFGGKIINKTIKTIAILVPSALFALYWFIWGMIGYIELFEMLIDSGFDNVESFATGLNSTSAYWAYLLCWITLALGVILYNPIKQVEEQKAQPAPVAATEVKPQVAVQSAPQQVQEDLEWVCPMCGQKATGKFCKFCGAKRPF